MARKIWTEILVPTTSASEQIRKSYPCLREALDLILQEKRGNLRTASGFFTMEKPLSCTAPLNSCNNFPADLEGIKGICDWQEIDINEFKNDNMDTTVLDASQNISSPNCDQTMLQPTCDQSILPQSCDYNMNQWSIPNNNQLQYDSNANTSDCIAEMPSSPMESMPYGFQFNCCAGYMDNSFQDAQFYSGYSPNNSLETSSSPDSSLNDSYRQDSGNSLTLLHSNSWPPDDQNSDDSVELDLNPLDNSSRQDDYSACHGQDIPFNAYRQRAFVLPHFDICSPPKHRNSKRGRPVTYLRKKTTYNSYYSGDSSDEDERFPMLKSPTKCKSGAKNVLLWKFLLEELNKPNGNNVQWVDEREGLFRFVDTTEVSKLWGMKKNKEDEKE